MPKLVYADYAAATPVDLQVLQAMLPYFSDKFYNPSALYSASVNIRSDIGSARQEVALVLGSRPSEIIFTAGATEANNLVIRGVMEQFPGKQLIVSSIEHDSVLQPAAKYDAKIIGVDASAIVDLSQILAAINDDTVLISVMYANNEVGSIQPIRKISAEIKKIRNQRRINGNLLPLFLHTDAAQAANYLDIHVSRLGVDFMTLNGGKIYGPKQTGVLFAAASSRFVPQVTGGGQERGLRAGTENVPGFIGLAKALQAAQAIRADESKRVMQLRDLLIQKLVAVIPNCVINGSTKMRLPNNVHVTLPGLDNERVLLQLDSMGIMAAAGSACSASSDEPSHVLKAMGRSDSDARSSIRFTLGRQTTENDIRTISLALEKIIADKL